MKTLTTILMLFALYQISQFPARERVRKNRIAALENMKDNMQSHMIMVEMEIHLMEWEYLRMFNLKPFELWKERSCVYPHGKKLLYTPY